MTVRDMRLIGVGTDIVMRLLEGTHLRRRRDVHVGRILRLESDGVVFLCIGLDGGRGRGRGGAEQSEHAGVAAEKENEGCDEQYECDAADDDAGDRAGREMVCVPWAGGGQRACGGGCGRGCGRGSRLGSGLILGESFPGGSLKLTGFGVRYLGRERDGRILRLF